MDDRKFDPLKIEALMIDLHETGRMQDISARYISEQLGGDYNKIAKAVSEFKEKSGIKGKSRLPKSELLLKKALEQRDVESNAASHQRLRGMQLEIEELESENKRLVAEVVRLGDEITQIPKLQSENADNHSQIQNLKIKKSELEDQIQIHIGQAATLQSRNIELERRLQEEITKSGYFQGESASLKIQIEQMRQAQSAQPKRSEQVLEHSGSLPAQPLDESGVTSDEGYIGSDAGMVV